MSKIKELPYKQGEDAARAGKTTHENPYWDEYDKGLEWAFYAWLQGWDEFKRAMDTKEKHG